MKQETPLNGQERNLPEHLGTFIELSTELELEMGKKLRDPVEITKKRAALKASLALMTPEEQADIRNYVTQGMSGQLILDESGKVNSGIQRLMNVPHLAVKNVAATLPRFAHETVRLIGTTLGLAVTGLYKSYKEIRGSAEEIHRSHTPLNQRDNPPATAPSLHRAA